MLRVTAARGRVMETVGAFREWERQHIGVLSSTRIACREKNNKKYFLSSGAKSSKSNDRPLNFILPLGWFILEAALKQWLVDYYNKIPSAWVLSPDSLLFLVSLAAV